MTQDELYENIEEKLREQIAKELEVASHDAVESNEFNFNDTAVRAKTFLLAAAIARGIK
jgi:hypothetical protein